jgi:hypothetical protein
VVDVKIPALSMGMAHLRGLQSGPEWFRRHIHS